MRCYTPRIDIKHNAMGGEGDVIGRILGEEEDLRGKCKIFKCITLEPGCSIGYHTHVDDVEFYYFLSGEGTYKDNDEVYLVHPGDATICNNGDGHEIANRGTEPLTFIALIIN